MADEKKPKKSWLGSLGGATKLLLGEVSTAPENRMEGISTFDADYVGVEMLLGSSDRPARSRSAIYQKWHYMIQDGLISTILRLHVQMALGGHETTGETIFIEPKPGISAADKKAVDELQFIAKILNKHAHSMCFTACAFGDAYARLYTQKGEGMFAFDSEQPFAPLVQAYEEIGQTVGYIVSLGSKLQSRFNHLDMVRMRMPRMVYLPQMRAIENAQKINLEATEPRDMRPLPALVGGSFLEAAEVDYDNLMSALRGMIGQRIAGSIDETMIGANLSDMTAAQQKLFMDSLEKMLISMKTRAEEAVKTGQYATSRNFHVMPTFNEKQLTQISSFQGGSNSGAGANIEDVMFCARKLAGTLGIDLSMVGFADQMTGGLGEGGFNRTSSQAAERSRIIRTAFMQTVNDTIDRHMLAKDGKCWADDERPYDVNFFGSIAALEAEKQASRERSINAGVMLLQGMDLMRTMGLPESMCEQFMATMMEIDTEKAKIFAKGLKEAKPPAPDMGGGFGGGDDDQQPPQLPAPNGTKESEE
jgi:hypothetical protein